MNSQNVYELLYIKKIEGLDAQWILKTSVVPSLQGQRARPCPGCATWGSREVSIKICPVS